MLDDTAWRKTLESLATRAAAQAHDALAAHFRSWEIPEFTDRQIVVTIPARLETPDWIDEAQTPLWGSLWRAATPCRSDVCPRRRSGRGPRPAPDP